MKFILRFTAWATLAFVGAWFIHGPWQHAIGAVGAKLAAPPGSEIEIVDIELFYPFDLGVFVALCLASSWDPFARRLRALAMGLPVLIVVEVLSLVIAFKVMMAATDVDQAVRFTNGIIRVSGLVAASAVWLYLLGRAQLSLAAQKWLGS